MKSKYSLVLGILVALLGLQATSPPPVLAGPVTIGVTTPTHKTGEEPDYVRIGVNKDGTGGDTVTVLIAAGMNDVEKRDEILKVIKQQIKDGKLPKYDVKASAAGTGITIGSLKKGKGVIFSGQKTGEAKDEAYAAAALGGSVGFANASFAYVDANGGPSQFTAGLLTDVGELSFSFFANQLPSLDGVSITRAFFDALNPLAPSYGARVLNGGDFLEFSFDPSQTIGRGGVVFGTTALSEGVYGAVTAPEPGTITLLSLGLAALQRRRRAHRQVTRGCQST